MDKPPRSHLYRSGYTLAGPVNGSDGAYLVLFCELCGLRREILRTVKVVPQHRCLVPHSRRVPEVKLTIRERLDLLRARQDPRWVPDNVPTLDALYFDTQVGISKLRGTPMPEPLPPCPANLPTTWVPAPAQGASSDKPPKGNYPGKVLGPWTLVGEVPDSFGFLWTMRCASCGEQRHLHFKRLYASQVPVHRCPTALPDSYDTPVDT